MQIKIINPISDKKWDEFVKEHPKGTIFHLSNWAEVIYSTYHFKPYYLIMEDNSGKIKSGWPFFFINNAIPSKKLISIPFTDHIKPLISLENAYQNFFEKILEVHQAKKCKNVEIRGNFQNGKEIGFKRNNYYKNFVLNINPDIETIWKKCKQKSVRYSIKKAEKMGVKIEKSKEKDGIRIFYDLNVLTRKKHGVIPQPFSFFLNIWNQIINQGYGFVSIAWYNGTPIAASIFFEYKNTIYHKFNASDKNFIHFYPNYLILWDAIKYAYNKGIKYLDLGRTSPDNKGLLNFKRHWGAEEIDLPYYYYPEIRGTSSMRQSSLKYKIATGILRKTPSKILVFLGNKFYRYLA